MMMHECWQCDRAGFATFTSLTDHAEAFHSFSETEELVRQAVRRERDSFLRDLGDDWAVYSTFTDDDEIVTYKCSYTLDDNGVVELGEASPVRRKVVWLPAPEGGKDEAAVLYEESRVHAYEDDGKGNCKTCKKKKKDHQ